MSYAIIYWRDNVTGEHGRISTQINDAVHADKVLGYYSGDVNIGHGEDHIVQVHSVEFYWLDQHPCPQSASLQLRIARAALKACAQRARNEDAGTKERADHLNDARYWRDECRRHRGSAS